MMADKATQPSAATNRFVRQSIADTTRRTYETGQRSFMSYCASVGVKAGRASGVNAANWLAHLAEVEGKTSSTILNYKAAMRTWFLELQMNRANNPFDSVWVEKTLQGIQRDEAVKVREQEAKVADAPALTLDLLACFKPQLLSKLSSIAQRMSWAAVRLAVTGLLRPNEFLGAYRQEQRALRPSQVQYFSATNRALTVEGGEQPSYLLLHLYETKADQLGKNPPRRIDDAETVQSMWDWKWERQHLAHTTITQPKLFAWKNGEVSGAALMKSLNDAARAHHHPAGFKLRSFRRGGASTLMAAGASTQQIMKAGGWKSQSMVDRYADPASKVVADTLRRISSNSAAAAAAASRH